MYGIKLYFQEWNLSKNVLHKKHLTFFSELGSMLDKRGTDCLHSDLRQILKCDVMISLFFLLLSVKVEAGIDNNLLRVASEVISGEVGCRIGYF